MGKIKFILSACLIMTFFLKTSFAETITSENETASTQVYKEFSDNNEAVDKLDKSSNAQTRLSFNPPSVGQVGIWVSVGSITTDAEAKQFILNNYIPSFLGEKISYSGKLGANVGDTLKLTIGASTIINLNYYGFSNPTYVPYVSWYGQMKVANLSAKSSSNAVSIKVANNSTGNYEITLTRNTAEKTENYEITLSYDYTLEYYVSMYINPPLGSGWSAWAAANTETISSKSISISVPAEPMSDNLSAEPVSQSINVGTDSNSLDLRDFVANVKIGNTMLNKSQFNVSLLDTTLDLNQIGNKTAKVRVTAVSDNSKAVNVDVPVNVLWGNTIVAKNASLSKVVASVSMLDNNGSPYLVANKGNGLSTTNYIGSRPYLKFYNQNLNSPKKTIGYSTVNQTATSLMNSWNTQLESVNSSLTYGDVLSFTVFRYANASQNYNGTNTWVSRNEQLVKEAEGYTEAYYELATSGLKLLHINQLTTNTIDVPIYSTNAYLDGHVSELIDLKGYSNISVKGFSEYPKTTASGKQAGKVLVEETLTTGKTVQYEYNVTVNVGAGALSLSVPKTITFNNFKKSKSDQVIQRRDSGNLGLVVNDNRGENAQGNWTLTAQVSTSSTGIAPYLVYRNEQGNDSYLNGSAVPVYTQTKQTNVSEPIQLEVSSLWTSNSGILLNVPSKNTLFNQSYSTTITWNLVEGP
ncbi:hypothetical protein FG877_00175 [Enterococcus casseliflavus]|nr:hypothetical protein [Enterococcus casseliflavus]